MKLIFVVGGFYADAHGHVHHENKFVVAPLAEKRKCTSIGGLSKLWVHMRRRVIFYVTVDVPADPFAEWC